MSKYDYDIDRILADCDESLAELKAERRMVIERLTERGYGVLQYCHLSAGEGWALTYLDPITQRHGSIVGRFLGATLDGIDALPQR